MKRVLTAVVLIPLVLLLVFAGPLWAVAVAASLVIVLATKEFMDLLAAQGLKPLRLGVWLILVVLIATMVISAIGDDEFEAWAAGFAAVILAPYLFLALSMRASEFREAVANASASALVLPYIAVPLSMVVILRSMESGWYYLLLLFTVVWSGDIFAYYTGRSIGRRKLAARISPNKTWEGAIGSLAGSTLLAILVTEYGPTLQNWLITIGAVTQPSGHDGGLVVQSPLWAVIGFAFVVNVSAQLGDLVESMMKRGAGVKDSGTLLPGHGGILDRVDALLLATPAAFLYLLPFQPYFVTRGF